MKLHIITAMHGRHEMTRAFCMAQRRIKDTFNISTTAVVSDDDEKSMDLCEEFDISYIEHKNKPLGAKWNRVVEYVKLLDYTHLMVLGSDDIVSDSFIRNMLLKGEYDIFGVWDLWLWGLNPRRAGYNTFGYWKGKKGHIGGVGRLISRKVVDVLDNKLWTDEVNYGMDGHMMKKMRSIPGLKIGAESLLDSMSFIMDVKYEHHISSLSPTLRNTIMQSPENILPTYLPLEEVEYLYELRDNLL